MLHPPLPTRLDLCSSFLSSCWCLASPPSPDQERKSSAPDSAPSSTHFQRLSFATAALIKSGAVACFTSPLNRRWSSSKGHLHQHVGHQQPPSSFSTAHYISHFAWRFSTPRLPTQALIHSPQPSTSFTPTVPVQPPRQSSRQRGPPTQLGDYDFGCEEDISHRRSRRVKAADFFSQAPDRPDSPPSALRAFQPPSPANHTDIITSSHSSPQLQPNPTPTIPHPGLVFEQSATRIRTSHS